MEESTVYHHHARSGEDDFSLADPAMRRMVKAAIAHFARLGIKHKSVDLDLPSAVFAPACAPGLSLSRVMT
jgi:hypothetical protein